MIPKKKVSELDFNYNSHWISKQCNKGLPFVSVGPLVTGVVKFGLIWNIVWFSFFLLQWGEYTVSFVIAWLLPLLWVNLAPFFIWLYDQVVMPEFYRRFLELHDDRSEIEAIAKRYNEFYAKPRVFSSALWAGFVVVVVWAGTPVLREMGMSGSGELFLFLTYGYAVYIGGVLGGPGFMGPITTALMIREIAALDFDIQPLHPDQLGGLSNVGYCSIRTTLLYSTASLFFPIGFQLAAGTHRGEWIWLVLGFYILSVVASFIYPTLRINRKAAQLRSEVLDELRERSLRIQSEIENQDDSMKNVNKQLELQRVKDRYNDYNDVRLYPMQIDIFIKLGASVFLPLFMLFIEFYILTT